MSHQSHVPSITQCHPRMKRGEQEGGLRGGEREICRGGWLVLEVIFTGEKKKGLRGGGGKKKRWTR